MFVGIQPPEGNPLTLHTIGVDTSWVVISRTSGYIATLSIVTPYHAGAKWFHILTPQLQLFWLHLVFITFIFITF